MSRRPVETMPPAGPFSRPLEVDRVPEAGLDEAIEASEAERLAIVGELGLAALDALAATFHIAPRAGGRLAVAGRVQAAITQICVVSLEPFDSLVERTIELEFAPQARPAPVVALPQRSRRRESVEREAPPRPVVVPGNDDQADPPDLIVDGRIDLGAIALEFLTLSLDLYPRKPGVAFTDVSAGEAADTTESPFAALQRLKDRS